MRCVNLQGTDCEENVGGYYCQVYTDENCI